MATIGLFSRLSWYGSGPRHEAALAESSIAADWQAATTNRRWDVCAMRNWKRIGNELTNWGTGNSNWQTRNRQGVAMGKPSRSEPAARASARLATNSDLPTLGSPPTRPHEPCCDGLGNCVTIPSRHN